MRRTSDGKEAVQYASAEDRGVFRAEFGGGVLPMKKRQAGVAAYAA